MLDPELSRAAMWGLPQIDGLLGRDAMGPSPERLARLNALQQARQRRAHSPLSLPAVYSGNASDPLLQRAPRLRNYPNNNRFVRPVMWRPNDEIWGPAPDESGFHHRSNFVWKPNDDKWGPTGLFDAGYKGKELLMGARPSIRKNFNAILHSLTGNQFSKNELEKISREVIDNMDVQDALLLRMCGKLKMASFDWTVGNGISSSNSSARSLRMISG